LGLYVRVAPHTLTYISHKLYYSYLSDDV
jgi:hypothetical protein